jgi:hypothetical protein
MSSSLVVDLLSHIKTLSLINQRAIGAVVGAAVGDAATRPTHWVYDINLLESILGDKDPAFWHENVSPFYSLPTGRRSCYNEVGYCMLRSLEPFTSIGNIGGYHKGKYITSLTDFFHDSSDYAEALVLRKEIYDPAKKHEGRVLVPGPWQHAAVTVFLEHIQKGENISGGTNKETDGFCATIPLIARYVDFLTYAFGWSAFLCRMKFCDTLVVIFFKHTSSSSLLG